MEEVLYGCDVMPSAVHITGSTLSGVEPSAVFENSRLYTMPYGRQWDGKVAIGSLELLRSSSVLTLFNTTDPAMRTGSAGEETAAQVMAEFPDEGFDLVIMNPPFTSNTAKERMHIGTFAPAFAAFENDDKAQRDMSSRLSKLKAGTCYHGHAGMASAFAALAERKLKSGGTLALVMPLTATAASSWQAFRKLMAQGFTELMIVSIAANGRDMAFSSDTDMAECLVLARKRPVTAVSEEHLPCEECCDTVLRVEEARFVSLTNRPVNFAQAAQMGRGIITGKHTRRIDDGPFGGTSLLIGEETTGAMIHAICSEDGGP